VNVTPKRWLHDDALRLIPCDVRTQGVMVECEVTTPASAKGRTVYLHVPPDMIADLLLALRAEAIEQRR